MVKAKPNKYKVIKDFQNIHNNFSSKYDIGIVVL